MVGCRAVQPRFAAAARNKAAELHATPRRATRFQVTLKLGPAMDMGENVPKASDGWALAASGTDYAVWENSKP